MATASAADPKMWQQRGRATLQALMRGPDRKVVPTERSLVAQSLSVISLLLSFNILYQYVVPASSNNVQKQSFGIHNFYTYKCLRVGLSV